MKNLVYCVIPNLNGRDTIGDAIESLQAQTAECLIVVVENASTDGSADFIAEKYPEVVILPQTHNLGFAGGVNAGIRYAFEQNADFVALFNNDAQAKKDWLEHLLAAAHEHPEAGIVTGKFVDAEGKHIDSTGDLYTSWGLPFPRGRGEPVGDQYDGDHWVFGATGGASLYRSEMIEQIGLFDEDFFAYYEDVEISFRAQLAGWKVYYEPKATATHIMGATSSKIKGFTTYQTLKNLPMILWKDVPLSLWPTVFPRLLIACWGFIFSAFREGRGWWAVKGHLRAFWLFPKKIIERQQIQNSRTVSVDYIRSILTWDLPDNASKLRSVRSRWWRLTRRQP